MAPRSVQSAGSPSVVVNKYFNGGGASGAGDVVELLVIQNNLDMRGMIIKDFSASMVNDGGGKFTFTNDALWSSVRSGTLIVLRTDNSAADTTVGGADYNLDIGMANTTYFTSGGGTFDIATTEMVMIKAAGSGTAGVTGSIHVLAGGTAGAQFTATAVPKLIASGTSGANFFVFANNSTQSINDFDGTDATGGATGLTFGAGNNANNTAYINSLRGAGGPLTISINNVTQAETNSGTTTFSFTVSLSAAAPAGGVTFDIATQDNTATTADNDYVLRSLTGQNIPQGSQTFPFDVTVNGDTNIEPNETFFVNVTNVVNATPTSVQGTGTITNDDVGLTPIHTIQGNGNSSPFAGSAVTTSGIVTGLRSNGFFLQEPDATVDADPSTSEGIFVFTSSAPPAAAVVGNNVQVSGTVSEFVPASDPGTQSQTELTSPTVTLNSSGNTLPVPHTITAAETLVNDVNNLEKYEGMRVHVDSLTVGAPTGGNVDEVNATSASFGDFYGVVTGVPRPFREPGIEIPYATPTPWPSGSAPASAPTFDANPERIRVNSLGLTGSADLQVSTGAVVTGITGPLDYGFRTYTIDTDPPAVTPTPLVAGGMSVAPVPTPTVRELTIGSFNMQRFFDTTDDPLTSDVVLTSTAFNNRLNKASLAIRNVLRSPDVIGIEEMEGGPSGSDNSILQLVANKVNADAGTPGDYQAYLVRGNDVGGINVAFLVRSSRITVNSVTQYNKTETFSDPSGGTTLLNDRPPLVLRASIVQPSGATLSFSVIVNHLRSLGSVTLLTSAGAHTRVKRNLQAASLATLINEMQNGGARQVLPYDQNIVSVGDYNSFQFNDGYDDVIGVVKGTPALASQVVESSADLNNPDMTDLIGLLPADQEYSYTFGGNAQALDHTLVNQNMMGRFSRFAYARMDADFSDNLRNDPNRPERISDHDPEVAYFTMAIAPTASNGSISGTITDGNGSVLAGAVVALNGAQNRKTITDSNGNYHFDNVETNGFYTITPSRANFSFNPSNRSFSQVGNKTEAAFSGSFTGDNANPLDTAEYFVRQQYVDVLGRDPDESGFNYWSDQILACGGDASCVNTRRRDIAAAFFIEQEAQQTGSFIYDLYAGALGRKPLFAEYAADRQQVVGGATLDAAKTTFAQSFVGRAEFVAKHQANTNADSFVDALLQNVRASGIDLGSERANLINAYNLGADMTASRASVVRTLADNAAYKQSQYNSAFVLTEYFAYLRRDIDQSGYDFWVNVLNNGDAGNYRGMVCSFITSTEYQRRFSERVSRSNSECR